jgi:membrane protease YdiL (CAAX protease family)
MSDISSNGGSAVVGVVESGNAGRIGRALLLILAQMAIVFGLGYGVVQRLLPEGADLFTPTWVGTAFLLAIAPLSFWLLVVRGMIKSGGASWKSLGWQTDRLALDLLLGALGALVAMTLSLAPVVLSHHATVGELLTGIRQWSLLDRCYFALIGLQAAAIEESLFRGYLQPALCNKLGLVGGIVLTAVIFAIYHLNLRPLALSGKIGLGLVYGLLRGRDRSLFAPATTHVLTWIILGAL